MATYTPSTPIDNIGHKPPAPPITGGGDDGRSGDVPDYGARLRRARLGLICGIATGGMGFISLNSAYIFRRGLPTFQGESNSYVRDWGSVDLPWVLLGINTVILLFSSITMELARRKAARQAALAPVISIPGISLGDEKNFPWLGITVVLGFAFLIGQWLAWSAMHTRGFFVYTNPSSSFAFLLTIFRQTERGTGEWRKLRSSMMRSSMGHPESTRRRCSERTPRKSGCGSSWPR